MVIFFIVLAALLFINLLLFLFSRNKIEDNKSKILRKKIKYEEEIRGFSTKQQVQDA